jgi:phytoene synthase
MGDAARDSFRKAEFGSYPVSFLLPKPKRDGVYAFSAFCRLVGQAIHLPVQSEGAGGSCSGLELDHRLALFRSRLDALYDPQAPLPGASNDPETAILYAAGVAIRRYGIPREYFLDLVEGLKMDLMARRYATWNALQQYCRRMAGSVSLIMCGVLGLTHSGAREQAIELGVAMQLTEILRDVKKDYQGGRIYLPLEDMVRFGYSERDLAGEVVNDSFRGLMRFEIERARALYRSGAEGICWLAGDGSRLAAATTVVLHAGILDAIERREYNVFRGPAGLNIGQKLRRLPVAWRLGRRQPAQRLPSAGLF